MNHDILIVLLPVAMIIWVFSLVAMYGTGYFHCKQDAIKAGVAEYNKVTGVIEWKKIKPDH